MPSAAPVLVQPLRLAGPGDHRLVTDPLTALHGWVRTRSPGGSACFTSPCRTAALTADGPADHLVAWTVHGYTAPGSEPLWRAAFGSGTPAEVTAAFTSTLAEDLPTRHRDRPHGSPAAVLSVHGWRPADRTPRGFHDQVAPDGSAVYRHRLGHQPHDSEAAGLVPPTWSMIVGDRQHPSWQAEFTIGTPFHPLVNAVLAFSDPGPVRRRAGNIPVYHLTLVTVRQIAGSVRRRPAPADPSGLTAPPAFRPAPAARRR